MIGLKIHNRIIIKIKYKIATYLLTAVRVSTPIRGMAVVTGVREEIAGIS